MAIIKKKALTKEQKLKQEISELKGKIEFLTSQRDAARGDYSEMKFEFNTYKNQYEGRRDAYASALEKQVHDLLEIIRWNANKDAALCKHMDNYGLPTNFIK